MDDKSKSIIAQTAYKCASWIHAAEVQTGASPDLEYLQEMARTIANGMVKIGGVQTADSPASGGGGGAHTEHSSPSSRPSCPKCNEFMDLNQKWTGLGDYEGHNASESIRWRCSMRGRFVKGKGWEGCDGAKWEDITADLPKKEKSA